MNQLLMSDLVTHTECCGMREMVKKRKTALLAPEMPHIVAKSNFQRGISMKKKNCSHVL